MTAEPVAPPLPVKRVAVIAVAAILIAMSLVWCFLSMRAVLGVGGACADGGPYVSVQPCPDGTWLIAIAVPILILAAMGGSAAAITIGAPDLLLPMWFLLFGSLGANFLDYGFGSNGWDWGSIVCGVVFELMAFPALYLLLPIPGTSTWVPQTQAQRSEAAAPRSKALWWLAYVGLGLVGATIGYLVWEALR